MVTVRWDLTQVDSDVSNEPAALIYAGTYVT